MEFKRRELLNRINRLSHDLSANHKSELRELKSEYNRIMDDRDNVPLNVRRDILDIFPSELWIQIVKDALPTRGYSSALLLLTMVSSKWMKALTSVPTLWTCIDLRGSQEDSEATIEVFKQLSGDIPLNLSIYVPTRHDFALIQEILTSVASRLFEVTIRQDSDTVEEPWSMLSFFLRNRQYTYSVLYIHLEHSDRWPLYDRAVARLIGDTRLPPSLRGLSRWRFLWKDFQQADSYLQNLDEIEAYDPLERVLPPLIQLPSLKSVKIYENPYPDSEVKFNAYEGLPRLTNLTSLTYKNAFREALHQILTSVAPRLLYLELRIPHAKIPLLVSCLQTAMSLRTLSVDVDDWNEYDQGERHINNPLVLPAIIHKVPSLKELSLCGLSDGHPSLSDEGMAYRGPLFSSIVRAISILYQNAETLDFKIDSGYSMYTADILRYVSGLNMLKKLSWMDYPGHFEFSKETTRKVTTLEYLETSNPELLCCLRATNLLSLRFNWGYDGKADNLQHRLKHNHLRTLCITYEPGGEPMIDLPEDSFPSLIELTLVFRTFGLEDEHIYGSLKLASFQMLSSITISSRGFAPHETMLCFALLYQPDKCPALNEIRFRDCLPDWDALFLMLEMRNFMADATVSRIRTMTLPFIPNELHAPLVSLLGGRHVERPSNEDLIMGGARELIFDETVPGCLTCLLDMRADCEEKVLIVGKDALNYAYDQSDAMRIRFHPEADPEHADVAIVEWIKQRRALHRDFLERLDSWGEKYQRMSKGYMEGDEVEITEYGVRAMVPSEL